MSEINTTPLVDVMLVLLIVFMITIPVITHTVPVDLPKVRNEATKTKPENINLSVNKEGQVFWNQSLIADNAELLERLKAAAVLKPQPEVHVRADQTDALRVRRSRHSRCAARRHPEGRVHHRTRPGGR